MTLTEKLMQRITAELGYSISPNATFVRAHYGKAYRDDWVMRWWIRDPMRNQSICSAQTVTELLKCPHLRVLVQDDIEIVGA